MRRSVTVLVAALALVSAGCVGSPTEGVSVTYEVRAGQLPEELRSVNVTLRVVFVENRADLERCWRDAFRGPYKPTVTPIGTPAGECHRSAPLTVDLADLEGGRSLGPATAPASFAAGHGLVVTNVSATYRNGTAATRLRGTGGHVANAVRGRPDGPYRVELSVESFRDRPYRYWLVSETTPVAANRTR